MQSRADAAQDGVRAGTDMFSESAMEDVIGPYSTPSQVHIPRHDLDNASIFSGDARSDQAASAINNSFGARDDILDRAGVVGFDMTFANQAVNADIVDTAFQSQDAMCVDPTFGQTVTIDEFCAISTVFAPSTCDMIREVTVDREEDWLCSETVDVSCEAELAPVCERAGSAQDCLANAILPAGESPWDSFDGRWIRGSHKTRTSGEYWSERVALQANFRSYFDINIHRLRTNFGPGRDVWVSIGGSSGGEFNWLIWQEFTTGSGGWIDINQPMISPPGIEALPATLFFGVSVYDSFFGPIDVDWVELELSGGCCDHLDLEVPPCAF